MKEKVIAVFDVGKTNKKVILFNYDLKLISEAEEKFAETTDDDGFPCDDIEHIESWINESATRLVRSEKYDLTAINFATYGATLAYLDDQGKRLTPVYNYLKPIDEKIPEKVYKKSGGQDEFCRRTASPALGMLNSGIQALWLKYTKPDVFSKVKYILHFPQYLSYLLTGKVYSEHTSIGCHTALWDFDNMTYHHWVSEEGLKLPDPADVSTLNDVVVEGKNIKIGIGIHDSSSSLAPYFAVNKGKFLLISTGTWCINMNPFNSEILTADQLDRDCLCYMSINRQPVKSSRLFLGHLHEVAVNILSEHFNTPPDYYKSIKVDNKLLEICKKKCSEKRFFFDNQPYSRVLKENLDFFAFKTFAEGYHQLMVELSQLAVEAIDLVIPEDDNIENIYITGGFSGNSLFTKILSESYSMKSVFTSEISNATALGAALVILPSLDPLSKTAPDLGLNQC
jgi:sugar (pentulose or hexulose) kinase